MERLQRLFAPLLVALIALLMVPGIAAAQPGSPWRQRATSYFTILYTADSEMEAGRYAAWVDEIYLELAAAFGFRTAPPLNLRLYPTSEDYYQVNPAARNVPGVIAHADFQRRELVVIVERTFQQTEVEVRNNVRHELTHIIAAELSENRLNTGFQEGLAQYMEHASGELERRVAMLRVARDQGRLLPWTAFDYREQIYGAPEVAYPQTLSVVAFLVDRNGFAQFREFLRASARSSGYRSALERVYGRTPTELEAEWRDWLPGYLDGGYRRNAVERYDLALVRDLVTRGNYAAAVEELQQTLEWLRRQADTQPPDVLDEAEALLARAQAGMRAEELAERARVSLEAADYERALALIDAARTAYGKLNDTRQAEVLAMYEQRAMRGLRASAQLAAAGELARTLRYPEARAAADGAAAEFAALGDTARQHNALSLRATLDQRQRLAGLILVLVGALGVALSLAARLLKPPSEVW